MKLDNRSLMIATVLATLAASGSAFAQAYRWVDAQGRVQYSDRAPPSHAREQRVVKPALPPVVAAAQGATLAEQEAAFRKRQAEREKAAKDAELKAAAASARSQDCERAKLELGHLQSGMRIQRMDAQGELYWMDDAQRAQEIARVQGAIGRNCRS